MHVRTVRPVLRGLIGAGAAAALLLPAASYAETQRHSDPAHDVQDGSLPVQDVPHNTTADIVHVTIAHHRKTVDATIRLRRYAPGRWVWVERIKTDTASYTVQGNHSTANGTAYVVSRGRGNPEPCRVAQTIDRAHDSIRVSVPTSCLRVPGWVQVGVGYVRPVTSHRVLADDGLRTRGIKEQRLTLSRRLRA